MRLGRCRFAAAVLAALVLAAPGSARAGPWTPLATDVAAFSQLDLWVSEWLLIEDRQFFDEQPRPELGKLETRFLDEHAKAHPGNAGVLVARGLHHMLRGNPGKAVKDFDRALKKQPRDAAALYHRGLARERQGRWSLATADYEAAAAADPDGPFADGAVANLAMMREGPSEDQRKTIERHGLPDGFSIHVAANHAKTKLMLRTEIWSYHRLGRELTFVEGRLWEEQRFKASNHPTIHPLYRPYQFPTGMRFVDMVEMIREEKYFYMEIVEEVMRAGELVATSQLVAGFKDGGLFYVRTQPLVLE